MDGEFSIYYLNIYRTKAKPYENFFLYLQIGMFQIWDPSNHIVLIPSSNSLESKMDGK